MANPCLVKSKYAPINNSNPFSPPWEAINIQAFHITPAAQIEDKNAGLMEIYLTLFSQTVFLNR